MKKCRGTVIEKLKPLNGGTGGRMMAENKMADVAKLLGVELGEEFEICRQSVDFIYRFTENNFEFKEITTGWGTAPASILCELLKGSYTIKKKPWKPRKGSSYFVPSFLIKECTDRYTWYDVDSDEDLYEKGLVCRTEDEARALADEFFKMARKMRGMDGLGGKHEREGKQ